MDICAFDWEIYFLICGSDQTRIYKNFRNAKININEHENGWSNGKFLMMS